MSGRPPLDARFVVDLPDLLRYCLANLELSLNPATPFVIPSQEPGVGRIEFEVRLTVIDDRDVVQHLTQLIAQRAGQSTH